MLPLAHNAVVVSSYANATRCCGDALVPVHPLKVTSGSAFKMHKQTAQTFWLALRWPRLPSSHADAGNRHHGCIREQESENELALCV